MATLKQIIANRINSQRSTGPNTEAGKAQTRCNALKHGCRARTLVLMPDEDPAEYAALVDGLIAEHRPATPTEDILVRHLADLSWMIDRAKWHEGMLLHQQVSDAMTQAERDRQDRHAQAVTTLLPVGSEAVRAYLGRTAALRLRTEVETTAEGCRRLLAVWQGLRATALAERPWDEEQTRHAFRLMDVGPDTIDDPATLDFFVAHQVARNPTFRGYSPDNWNSGFLKTSFVWEAVAAALERRPTETAAAFALLVKAAEHEIARLEGVLTERERDGDLGANDTNHATVLPMFDTSTDGEKMRKYRASLSAELLRTLDALARQRRERSRLNKELAMGANEAKLQSPTGVSDPQDGANEAKLEEARPENRTIRNEPRPAPESNKANFAPELGANESIWTRRQKRQMRKQEQEMERRAKRIVMSPADTRPHEKEAVSCGLEVKHA
jgi:hypothetical protein